jgi:hypothetical protein
MRLRLCPELLTKLVFPLTMDLILYLKLCDIFSEHAEDLLSVSTLNLHDVRGVLSLIAENKGFLTFPC